MLPDRWNIDVFESACTKVAFYSDPCWMVSDPDNYNRANQALWINYNRIKNRYEELDSPKVRTVRDTIPSSNLAKYGNYEYDDVRENLYETDDTQPLYADDKRYQDSCVEPWMLPEVENEFKRLTAVEEYKLWRPDVRIQRPSTCIDGHIWTCEHSWQIQSWAAMLIFHYPQIVSNIEERSQGSCQRSLYCDGGDVLSELEKYPTPRYSLNSPEAAELHRRVTLPSVRSLWDDSEPAEEPKSCIFTQRTMPLSVDCQPPEYFPSANESHEDLFPYLKQLQPFTTSTPNKSCDQENMDFQSQLMELSSIADKQGPWDRYDEAVCVDDSSEEGDLLDWLQSVYPSRVHDFTALETLMGEMKKIEEQLAEENSKTSCLPASLSTDALAAPSTSTSENTSTSSGATPKRRLYRDVLASTIPAPEVTTAAPVVASPKSETCVAATVSTSSLEKKFEELEQQALEQYRSSDDSIAQHFQELERQAIEQYQPGSSSDSDFSISSCDEQVKEPQPLSSCKTGSKNCDSGIKLKRTHSHHDLVLAGRPRPAAASRSVCNMGPGTAASAAVIAATRPETLWAECGQGSGDRLPTKGNTTRRNLLLDSPDRRTRKALSLSTDDSSDSEHDESTLLTLPSLSSRPTARPRGRRGSEIVERKLLTSPTSIRGRRKALAAAHRIKADRGDGGGGGDDKPTEEVIIVPRNDAGPNEKRTQVSHRPRIQSANISKGGPVEAGVTETWVQPTFQPKMRATLLIDQEEKFPRADLQTLGSPQYSQLKKRKRGRRRKKKKNRLVLPKPLPVSSSFKYLIHGLNFTELYFEGSTFRIRMWRLIGLVPYTVIENGSNISPKKEVIKNMSNCGMLLFLQGNRLFPDWPEDRKHYRSCWENKKDILPKVSVYDTKNLAQNNWSAMAIKLFLEKTEIPNIFGFPWKEVRSWVNYQSVLDLIMTENLDRKDRHEAKHKNICRVRDASTQTAPTIANIIQSEKQKCCCRGEMLATLARALQVVRCRRLIRKWNSSSAFLDSVASNSSKRNSVQWRRSSLFGVQRPWCSEDTMASTSFLASTINSPQERATLEEKDVVDDESSSNCTHVYPYDVADETLPTTVPSVKVTFTNERPETANRIKKFQPSPHIIDSQSWMNHKPTPNFTYRPGDKPECEIIQIEPDIKRGTLPKPASEDEFKWTDKFLRRQKYKRKNDDVSGYIKQKKTQTCSVL